MPGQFLHRGSRLRECTGAERLVESEQQIGDELAKSSVQQLVSLLSDGAGIDQRDLVANLLWRCAVGDERRCAPRSADTSDAGLSKSTATADAALGNRALFGSLLNAT